ncbi:major histocompatibility complex class I-related gene protein-like isoform X2 [Entelurus aequoreus]|uniref:major histocompatibility complex class I-related gene protein-like isoform X2 n=1 Tax=Entelurus aequoreus TaxID=161455 RepID=UPI002B1DF7DC|nr:major histocompatibility complex class I-related gene protein-like isoform X2 [Entelurus aequoreus]
MDRSKRSRDHIKLIWDNNKAPPDTFKFNTEECPSYLKMFVSILTRTELPKVSLLQETPSSLVSCNATGFYPDKAVMFWRKDGEKLHEGVEHGEMLQDGTFQMSVDLNVTADMKGKYECVFQLTGVKEDIVTKLESRSILSNASGEDLNTTISGNNSQATSRPTTITIRPTTNATARPSLNNSEPTPPTPGHKNLSIKVAVVTVGVVAGAVLLSAIIFGIVKRYRRTHSIYWDTMTVRFTRSESE